MLESRLYLEGLEKMLTPSNSYYSVILRQRRSLDYLPRYPANIFSVETVRRLTDVIKLFIEGEEIVESKR